MEFTDKEKRERIHNGMDEINEYIKGVCDGVIGYTQTHLYAHKQGISVDLSAVPKTMADLAAREVYIDQRKIIDKLRVLLALAEKGVICMNAGRCSELPKQEMWCPACVYFHKKKLKEYQSVIA